MLKNASNFLLHKSKSQIQSNNRKGFFFSFPTGKKEKKKGSYFWLQSDVEYSSLTQWFMNIHP